ncbi:MAG: hypothetical protein F4X26_10615 [Chloroflexi bacterium]|nr:hypothetical protein [Chloroflexota bacterium]MYD66413.1 hypothetical protein [Chloroflexota bacterium]
MTTGDVTRETTAAHAGEASADTGGAVTVAAVHSGPDWKSATDAVLASLADAATPDLGLVFIDSRFADHYGDVLARLRKGTGVSNLVGASGEAVIGPGVEAQIEPAVSFLGVSLPGLEATTISLPTGAPLEPAMERVAAAGARAWLIFADPFSIDAEPLVRAMEARARDVPLLGGLASSHDMRGGAAVFAGGEVQAGGAVLVGLKGEFNLHSIVAQGAEPIGQPWTVTACEGNIVRELGSRPALEVLQDTLASLDPETRARAQRNLLVGLAMDEYRYQHGRGDYLVRNVMGGDRESGAISVNAIPRVGQTFQFQFRDAAAADEDLRAHLAILKQRLLPGETVVGAVLCACNGRGQGLFGTPHHDAQALADALGPVPTAGIFASGEIGPVAGTTFLHGFTASIALLTARAR